MCIRMFCSSQNQKGQQAATSSNKQQQAAAEYANADNIERIHFTSTASPFPDKSFALPHQYSRPKIAAIYDLVWRGEFTIPLPFWQHVREWSVPI